MKNSIEKIVATFVPTTEDVVGLTTYFKDGQVDNKQVAFSEFQKILYSKENMKTVENVDMRRLPRLPKGYYMGAVNEEEENSFSVLVHIPAGRRFIHYYGECIEVPFPSLMFASTVVHGKQIKSGMYALDTDYPNEESQIYHYPFGNVYTDFGKICWGNSVIVGLSSILDIDRVLMTFFDSETNDDLFRTKNKDYTQRQFLEKIRNLKEFPRESFIKMDGTKVENLIKAYL